jgi:hypothetical protein
MHGETRPGQHSDENDWRVAELLCLVYGAQFIGGLVTVDAFGRLWTLDSTHC